MKRVYKMLSVIAVSGMLVLTLSPAAFAQHDHNGGGGGGGAFHSAPVSGGGGGHVSAPAPSVSRPSFSQPQHSAFSPSRVNTQQHNNNNFNRPNNVARPNFVPRSGAVNSGQFQGHTGAFQNHVVGGASRVGVTSQNYRTFQRSPYGHNYPGSPYGGHTHGYLPGNTYYHYNHGYYGTYYRPRLGFAIGVLPYGYYPFYYGDYQYYYSDGLFYQYDNDQYTVVEPPVGAQVNTLPSNAQSIVINGQQFYEVDGVYYKPITKDDGTLVYEVAGKDGELETGDDNGGDVNAAPQGPQIGDMVPQLPDGCRRLKVNGQMLYLSQDGVYYQQVTDQSGATEYKVVGLPEDDGNGDQQQ